MPAAPPIARTRATRRWAWWLAAWLIAIGIALTLDWRVTRAMQHLANHGYRLKGTALADVLKAPGDFRFTLVVAAVAVLCHPWKWRAAGLLALSAMLGGLAYTILKWTVGRHRPVVGTPYEISPFIGGWRGLFVAERNLTFPSGHATCAFATAAALAILFPRLRYVFFFIATLTAAERVVEGAHYLSDVIAAAGIGVLCVQLSLLIARRLVRPTDAPAIENPPMPSQAGHAGPAVGQGAQR